MLYYSIFILLSSFPPLLLSLSLLYLNMFISIEIPLFNSFSLNFSISILLDWMSCMFLSTVLWISALILSFSMYYIPSKEHKQFSLMLLMFVLSMLLLILSDNIIFILLGWDGLGLSSYILVIYYQNASSASSGTITILSNRVGDIMILISIAFLMMNMNWNFIMNNNFNMISLTLLLAAACSKSAQFPFSAWLPAAMAAPTPISALVHSSTLVTAGVYLLIRLMNNIHPWMISTLLSISSLTMLFASLSANWEQDMKKIIALSTLSQIAMMMFAISMKSVILAFFHLIIHALFKSSMFMCAGIMIHNSSYQDMRMMGMNYINSPMMLSTLSISNMALMGLPFMSGFFSKDSILETMMLSKTNMILSSLMIFSLGLTVIYSIRMLNSSLSFNLKSKPDLIMHKDMFSPLSILLITPMSVCLGSSMMWIISPQQLFILPPQMKFSIPIMLVLGLMTGMMYSFKNKNFNLFGNYSISLWFSHILTTYMFKFTPIIMNIMSKNDMSWQEMYGPTNLYFNSKKMTMIPNLFMFSLLLTSMMIFIFPFMIK